jgi:hypothetical protein
MTDQAAIIAVPPLTCSGSSCLSYFVPGPIVFDDMTTVSNDSFPDAIAWIVNAPGYQIDYSPVTSDDPPFSENYCQTYGVDWAAIVICTKQVGASLLAGIKMPKIRCC